MKKLLLMVVFFAVLAAVGWFYLQEQEFVVVLSEENLQERIEEVFPVERQYLILLTLRLSNPEVGLVEGSDRIHYRMRASLNVPGLGQPWSGMGRVSGRLRYDRESRDLFLYDSVVEEIEVEGLPQMYEGPLRSAADWIARQRLDRHPVYTIDEETLGQLPGPVILRDVRVGDGKVRVAFGLEEPPGLNFWRERLGW